MSNSAYIKRTLYSYIGKPLRVYCKYDGNNYSHLPPTDKGYIGQLINLDENRLTLRHAMRYYSENQTEDMGDFDIYYDDIKSIYNLSGTNEIKILGGSNKGGKKQNKSKKQRKSQKQRKSRKNKSK
jgi:hypothetical protein